MSAEQVTAELMAQIWDYGLACSQHHESARERGIAIEQAIRRAVDSAALSAEPAQEMTAPHVGAMDDFASAADLVDAMKAADSNGAALAAVLKYRGAAIAADRASRLPEMGEGDWPELPEASGWVNDADIISARLGRERYGNPGACELHAWREGGPHGRHATPFYTAEQYRAGQVAAVEAYKALVRGKP